MENYHTEDLYLSSYLISIGFTCSGLIEKQPDQGLYSFIFLDNPQLVTAVNLYYNGQASVNPLLYSKNFKHLKGLLIKAKNGLLQGGDPKGN